MIKRSTRLIQVFLSKNQTPYPGIFEVSISDEDSLFCTCPGFVGRNDCRHVRFVSERIKENNGTYPLEISNRAHPEDAELAKGSKEAFREFIIRYGKIEVF